MMKLIPNLKKKHSFPAAKIYLNSFTKSNRTVWNYILYWSSTSSDASFCLWYAYKSVCIDLWKMIREICPSNCFARFVLCSVPDECCWIIHPFGICIDPGKNKAEGIRCVWSGEWSVATNTVHVQWPERISMFKMFTTWMKDFAVGAQIRKKEQQFVLWWDPLVPEISKM